MVVKFLLWLMMLLLDESKSLEPPQVSTIAHAGGGINGQAYTNSFEALNHNYEKGFRLFELDFVWTEDHYLVCLHDWQATAKWLLNHHDEQPVTLQKFNQLSTAAPKLTPCDLKGLNQWLIDHPQAFIVTDIKEHNITGLEWIKYSIDDAENRIIPQIYQPFEYEVIRDMGYQSIIWTLYKFRGSNQTVVRESKEMDLLAITMPKFRAVQGLAHLLNDLNVATYVHTINDALEAQQFQREYGVRAIYTDHLHFDLTD